jgi:4-hydroxybenzoate polyprenyltransferase
VPFFVSYLAQMLKKIFDFFLFSSLYISCCAIVMVWQANQLLRLQYDRIPYLEFVFASTMCSYNFHWYLTPDAIGENNRIAWTRHHKTFHLILYGISLIASGWLILKFIHAWFWMCIPVGLTFLYSAPKIPFKPFYLLRKVAIGKTIYLSFVWMYVTTLLPVILDGHITTPAILFCCSRFFLIYAICILFDYRDRENDKKEGVRSMITYFDEQGINRLFHGSLLIFFVTTVALLAFDYSIFAIVFLLIPGIIVWLLLRESKRNFSDYLYYFVLDGLMMFSGLFTFFLRF